MSSSVQCAADQNFGASCVLSNVNCGISMCSDLCAGGSMYVQYVQYIR